MNLHRVGRGPGSPLLVRNRLLDSTGVYRVVRRHGSIVDVEVVAAPGLAPGARFGLTAATVAAMRRRGALHRHPAARALATRVGFGLGRALERTLSTSSRAA